MTVLVDVEDLVGPAEIARRVGIAPGRVRQWKARGLLPEPIAVISTIPLWEWPDIAPVIMRRLTNSR